MSRATLASKIIITMLPSSPHVKQVYLQGIIPTLKGLPSQDVAQTLCIDSTTLDVDVSREVSAEISSIGAQMVDAPVSGGKSISHIPLTTDSVHECPYRCYWSQVRHSFFPCRRYGAVFPTFTTNSCPNGTTDHPLRSFWCRSRCQNLQQCQ